MREGKVGSSTPASLIVEFEANWSQRRWALEYVDTETLPSALTRGVEEDLDLLDFLHHLAFYLMTHSKEFRFFSCLPPSDLKVLSSQCQNCRRAGGFDS